jgi:hypothetical protein
MTQLQAASPGVYYRHYVRNARLWNYWFDVTASRVAWYRQRFGDDFCLIINRSDELDDAYVIPFALARRILFPGSLDHRGRWVGTIVEHELRITRGAPRVRIATLHNAFEILGWYTWATAA